MSSLLRQADLLQVAAKKVHYRTGTVVRVLISQPLAKLHADGDLAGTRTMVVVNRAYQEPESVADRPVTIEDLARAQHAQPVEDPQDLAEDIWEFDEELNAFLADPPAARNSSLA